MLYKFTASAKRYVCERCAATPENFLTNLIADDLGSIITKMGNETPPNLETPSKTGTTDDKFRRLESKVSDLCDIVEKYDIPRVADTIQAVFENFNKLNKDLKENIAILGKSRAALEKHVVENQNSNEDLDRKEKLDRQESEIKALKAAEILLLESVREKDKLISKLSNDKEKHIKSINDSYTTNQSLQTQVDRYKDWESERELLENTIVTLKDEIERSQSQISSMRESCSKRENDLDRQCQTLQTENRAKQDIINHLTDTNNNLQGNLVVALHVSETLRKLYENSTKTNIRNGR